MMSLLNVPKPASYFFRDRLPNYQMMCHGNVFTSPNRESLPDPLPLYNELGPMPSPEELRWRIWATPTTPYTAFIFKTPLFGPMMGRFEKYKIEHDSYNWHLPRNTCKSWKRLEHGMRDAAAKLSSHFFSTHSDLRPFWDIPQKPSSYGYFDTHDSEQAALEAITSSINGFIVFSGYLSFLIALCRFFPPSKGPLQTTAELLKSAGLKVHPEWINGLHDSGIGNFSAEQRSRIGLIVKIPDCDWINVVPILIKANVSVWLYWGKPPFSIPRESWVSDLEPAPFWTPSSASPQHASSSAANQPSSSIPGGFPPVISGSEQRPGETIRAFLARRKEKNAHTLLEESRQLRQRRLNRQLANANHHKPGNNGARVYRWVDVDGFRIRTLLNRELVEEYWFEWGKSQRRYDAFSNQWDCCSELPSDFEDEEDDCASDASSTILPINSKGKASQLTQRSSSPIEATSDVTVNPSSVVLQEVSLSSSQISQVAAPSVEFGCSAALPTNSFPMPPPVSSIPPRMTPDMSVDAPPEVSVEVPQHLPHHEVPGRVLSSSGPSLRVLVSNARHSPGVAQCPPTPPPVTSHASLPPPCTTPDVVVDPLPERGYNSNSARVVWSTHHDNDDGLDPLRTSVEDVIAVNRPMQNELPLPPFQSIEDIVYYRYGFAFNETTYDGLPPYFDKAENPFNHWTTVCHAVGGQGLSSSKANHQPITDFLVALLNSRCPFHDVPGMFWDLSPANGEQLKDLEPIRLTIEVKEFHTGVLCLLHPRAPHSVENPPWVVAVPPITALECIRRDLGPSSIDIAEYLMEQGMPFNTLLPFESSSSSSHCPPQPLDPRPLLGDRSAGHNFDRADSAAYATLRDSFLLAQHNSRRALSFGGIIARLARNVLPDSDILAGPSLSARRGEQSVFVSGQDTMVDDQLSEEELDLICGTYRVATGKGAQTSMCSWFPRANVWASTGYNVGYWNRECEDWYIDRVGAILDGTAKPLTTHQWRQQIRKNRQAPKLVFQMNKAAEAYLLSSLASSFTITPMSH